MSAELVYVVEEKLMAMTDVLQDSRHNGLYIFLRRSARLVLLMLGLLVVAVVLVVVLNQYFS